MENNDRVSPAEIQKYLAGVNYPATKEDLLAAARQNGAPQEVIREMEDMDADDFGGPQDVMKAYGGHM